MTSASELRHRIGFERAMDINPDAPLDLGNTRADFVAEFEIWAKVQAKFGGETVTAARLEGQQPVTITVRQTGQTRQITTDWRARDTRTGTIYAIRSISDPDDRRAWLEILTQTGVAA
jgi:head-tail adaptor